MHSMDGRGQFASDEEEEFAWPEKFLLGEERCHTMELQNDPRFFQSNVIDKRLSALRNLTIVSSLMFSASIGQLLALKKEYNFTYNENVGWWCFSVSICQLCAFVTLVSVVFMCLIGLYTMCQQLYHIYRLMTSGPTGVELAGEYYLSHTIVAWRHTAVSNLLKGMALFVGGMGMILFVKFMKDGGTLSTCYASNKTTKPIDLADVAALVSMALANSASGVPQTTTLQTTTAIPEEFLGVKHYIQFSLATATLISFVSCAVVLRHIHATHTRAFHLVYDRVEMLLPTTRKWAQSSHVEHRRSPQMTTQGASKGSVRSELTGPLNDCWDPKINKGPAEMIR